MWRRLIYPVFSALLLCVSAPGTKADISSDLISYWRLDDGSGTTAKDSAGTNHGTLKGNAAWVVGRVGGGIMLDGDDDYVDCGQGTVFNTVCRDVITLAAWVKADPTLGPDWGGIIMRGYGYLYGDVSPYDTFAIYYHRSGQRLGFKTYGTSVDWLATANNAATSLFNGEWHHAAAVYDGAQKVIYLDNIELVRGASTGQISTGLGTGRVFLGGGRDADPMVIEFGGIIDEARIYNRALAKAEIQAVMEGGQAYPYALGPQPADGALVASTWTELKWSAGDFAASHDVYIGENFEDVNNGVGGTFRGNQTVASLFVGLGMPGDPYPGGLVPGTTYYWRIDEVNTAEPNSPWKGPVWSFSIPPKTAYSPSPADGAESIALSAKLTWTPGFGAKLHTVYIGTDFDTVNSATTGGTMAGAASYSPPSLKAGQVYYWRVDETDPPNIHKGPVWSFTTVGAVSKPHPSNGNIDAEMNAILSWTRATAAASHEVYFGTDKETVRKATATSPEYKGVKALGAESYDPGLLPSDSTYYWRIDEVNNTNAASPWKGPLWTFTTGKYLLVDDFEAYNDIDPPAAGSNRMFDKWVDGFGTTNNGAVVGNNLPPYAERTIVHGGQQAMPLSYDNNLKFSEATLTLSSTRNWTAQGVTSLSLWFRGASTNAAEKMYVALNGTAVVYHDNANAAKMAGWTPWVIPLQAFADKGVNLANVTSISIGLGTKGSTAAVGGTGKMYFDDIRLYRPTTP